LDFTEGALPPSITEGKWSIDSDGVDEIDIVDQHGAIIATLDRVIRPDYAEDSLENDAQCISLVPELVRALHVAMHALRGNIPDNETELTIAKKLNDLLKRCYSSPQEEGTIIS
jgi:hypothetical protein